MPRSEFVFEVDEGIVVGSHGRHEYVFAEGSPVTDAGVSELVFESGTGIGGYLWLRFGRTLDATSIINATSPASAPSSEVVWRSSRTADYNTFTYHPVFSADRIAFPAAREDGNSVNIVIVDREYNKVGEVDPYAAGEADYTEPQQLAWTSDGSHITAAESYGTLVAFGADKDGNNAWTYGPSWYDTYLETSFPTVYDGDLYIYAPSSSGPGRLVKLDPTDGTEIDTLELSDNSDDEPKGNTQLAIDESTDTLYFAMDDTFYNYYYGTVDLSTFSVNVVHEFGDDVGPYAIDSDGALYTSCDGTRGMSKWDPSTDTVEWTVDPGANFASRYVPSEDLVLGYADVGGLYAYNASDGSLAYNVDTSLGDTNLVDIGGVVDDEAGRFVTGPINGDIRVFDVTDGSELYNVSGTEREQSRAVRYDDGQLLVKDTFSDDTFGLVLFSE